MDSGIGLFLIIAALVFGRYVCTFLHELGHLTAALVAGWKPLVFRVGTGRRATVLKIGDLHVEFGVSPFGGLVQAIAQSPSWFRLKWFQFAMAGPMVSLGLCWLIWHLLDNPALLSWIPPWGRTAMELLLLLQVILFLGTMIPHTVKMDGLQFSSDGQQAFMSVRLPAKEILSHILGHQVAAAQIYLERGQEKRATAILQQTADAAGQTSLQKRMLLIQLLRHIGRREEADCEMEKVVAQAQQLEVSHSQTLDALACLPLFYGYGDLSERAMIYIDQAIKEEPQTITFKGTKGSLLVEANEAEAGLAMLEEVLRTTDSQNDIAISSYYIALAHSRLGHWQEARHLLQEATQKHPDCVVRNRVTHLFWRERE